MGFNNNNHTFKFVLSCLVLIGSLIVLPVEAQTDWPSGDSAGSFGVDPFGGDPFGGVIDSSAKIPPLPSAPSTQSNPSKASQTSGGISAPASNVSETDKNTKKAELPFSSAASRESAPVPDVPSEFHNAIIEGIQLTSDASESPKEKVISCYFIFRDKPSSYFYEINVREKKLIFEFHGTRTGASPVPLVSEPPIKGFVIETGKIDVNKDVKGLLPEWHDRIKVIFDLAAVPKINVSDEYSIISFNFKWTSDPEKVKYYTIKDNSRKVMYISTAGVVGGIGLGALTYFIFKQDDYKPPEGPISIDDLPKHDKDGK